MESSANMELLNAIRELKSDHPSWGYRRVWAYLRRREPFRTINRKRIYRLLKVNGLLVPKNSRLKASRTVRSKPRTTEPNRIWGTDMTKIMVSDSGWAYLHVVLDWGSKKIVGYQLDTCSKTVQWMEALDMALNQQFPEDIPQGLSLVSDHGSQPTSEAFMKVCRTQGIRQIFASYNNPKGNADTERVMRTIKEDLIWSREFSSFRELKKSLDKWVRQYNEEFPHSAIGYMTPYEYERWFKAATQAA